MADVTIRPIVRRGEPIPNGLVDRIVEINRLAWGSERLGGNREQILSRLKIFPEGQLGAFVTEGGKEKLVGVIHIVKGNINSLKDIPRKWDDVTKNGYFTNHVKSGNTAYCVSVASDPAHARLGIGSKLITAAYAQARKLGAEYVFAYSRFLFTPKVESAIERIEKRLGRKITLDEYAQLGIDTVIGWHCTKLEFKPKGIIRLIFPKGRPYDTAARGTNIVVEYTEEKYREWKGTERSYLRKKELKEKIERLRRIHGLRR